MTLSLRLRVWWLGDVVHDVVLAPPRDYVLGENDADFVMPSEVLGRADLPIVRVRGGRALIAVPRDGRACLAPLEVDPEDESLGVFPLQLGQRFAQSFGDFSVDVEAEVAVRSPLRRFHLSSSGGGYALGAALVCGSTLGAAAALHVPGQTQEEEREQIELMKHYLSAHAEREPVAGQGRAGAPGRLRLGVRRGKTKSGRRGVRGFASPSAAGAARATEAAPAEFGMIGPSTAAYAGSIGGLALGSAGGAAEQDDDVGGNAEAAAGADDFADYGINPALDPAQDPLSTFAADVDTGSYYVVKRRLEGGELPPLTAVRVEEMLNAFDYAYPGPESEPGDAPFRVHLDAVPSPFDPGRHFLRVAVQARRVEIALRPPLHLTYLVDTSGSMRAPDRLPLAQASLRLLSESLRLGDTVALCTYAGDVREVLPPTPAEQRSRILAAIDGLSAVGGTAMASGIDLAYGLAARTLKRGHESRVVVLSDGDANLGARDPDAILELIEAKRELGITLSTVGFGRGSYRDSTMERLADAGDGNYSYVGSEDDVRRVFGAGMSGLLSVVARDVKLQVAMDPRAVAEYRLIGYENRDVADGDFRKDSLDGGEVGAGHAVTALYEVVLRRTDLPPATLSIRYRPAHGSLSAPASEAVFQMQPDQIGEVFEVAGSDLRFAVSVAAFGEVLRGSPRAVAWSLDRIAEISRAAEQSKPERRELARLIDVARDLRAAGDS